MAHIAQVSVVNFTINSSSPNLRALLHFSGSHCSHLRMEHRNSALSSLFPSPCRVVSRSSRVLEGGTAIPAEKLPAEDISLAP